MAVGLSHHAPRQTVGGTRWLRPWLVGTSLAETWIERQAKRSDPLTTNIGWEVHEFKQVHHKG